MASGSGSHPQHASMSLRLTDLTSSFLRNWLDMVLMVRAVLVWSNDGLRQIYTVPFYRISPDTHMAWLADSTRSILNPGTLSRIIDVLHFEWVGNTGDVEYCP